MNLLLDSHVFIWWADAPEKLSAAALRALEDENNRLLLSVASIWEMQIKLQLGKMQLSLPLKSLIESQEQANKMEIVPITREHVFAISTLPSFHKDPFDRVLIAQGIVENATIVTADVKLSSYPVTLLW
jgi:PIN domain nuclease of toxin-antitoxin system